MKTLKTTLLILLTTLVISSSFAQKSDIRTYKLTVYTQNSQLGGNFVDLDRRHAYPLEEAGYNPKRIDFGFMYGTNTGANLMAPIHSGFLTFGNKYKEALLAWGNNRNNGSFINISNDKHAQETFDRIQYADSIAVLYESWFDKIMLLPDYKPNKHGPAQRIREMTIGDIILFRSENKDTYHIFRVNKLILSNTGLIEIEVKSSKNTKKKK